MSENTTNSTAQQQVWNPTLTATEGKAFCDALGQMEQKIPFLVGLSADERKVLPKVAAQNRAFIDRMVATAQANPGIVPRSIDVGTLTERVATLDELAEVSRALKQLSEKVADTEVKLAAELFGSARSMYAVMKTPASVAGLKQQRQRIGSVFARGKRPSAPAVTAVTAAAPASPAAKT